MVYNDGEIQLKTHAFLLAPQAPGGRGLTTEITEGIKGKRKKEEGKIIVIVIVIENSICVSVSSLLGVSQFLIPNS